MGRFKFRAWNNQQGKWITDCDLYMMPTGEIYAGDMDNPPVVHIKQELVSFSTGLKDKYGKEIYEGDIVLFIYGEREVVSTFDGGHDVIDAWSEEEISKVSFIRGSFLIGKHLIWAIDEMEMDYSIEIIGNIHEHSHLLKEERT